MKRNYDEWMKETIFAEAAVRELAKEQRQTGIKKMTMDDLMNMKFDVVEHFGMTRKGVFFIMNTVPPAEYGADCQNYEWYQVNVDSLDSLEALKGFIKAMFGVELDASTIKQAIKAVNNLDTHFAKTIKGKDFGACDVRFLPIADQFRREGVIYG